MSTYTGTIKFRKARNKKFYATLVTNNGDLVALPDPQHCILQYMVKHEQIKEGETLTLKTL